MNLKLLWPGKTKNREWKALQAFYLERIRQFVSCEVIETRETKGLEDKFAERTREIEAQRLEKYFKDDYIICLLDKGREMDSDDFARFLEKYALHSRKTITVVVGGFSGLAERILKRADLLLSFSRMTFSHELSRIVLLEQIYRSLTIMKGKNYAK